MAIGISDIQETGPDYRARLICFDNNEDMRTAATVVRALGLEIGAEYPDIVVLRELVNAAEAEQARARALRILNARDRTSTQMRTRLRQDGYGYKIVDALVDRFVELGLIDDVRYAESFISGARAAHKGWKRIKRELEQRGIDTELLSSPDPDEDLAHAVTLIERLPLGTRKDRERALRRLSTKGYDYDTAQKAFDLCYTDSSQVGL